VKDRGYEEWKSMILRRFLKTIQVGKNSTQVPRHFKIEERLKKDENYKFRA